MASPISISATKKKVALVNYARATIRFQNIGNKEVYIKKIPLGAVTTSISDSDYQVKLNPDPGNSGKGDSFDTNSVNAFVAISVNPGTELAVYETKFITL